MRRAERDTPVLLAIIGVTIALGAVAGMVWTAITPAMTGRVVGADSAVIPAAQFPEEFAGVGTFALLMLGYGVLCTMVAWFSARMWRGPGGFVIVAISSVLGAGLAAWLGTVLAQWRFDDPRTVGVGSAFRVVPDLWLDSASRGFSGPWILLICAPLAVALTYLVCALLSRTADLGVGDLGGADLGVGEHGGRETPTVGPDLFTSGDAASQTRR